MDITAFAKAKYCWNRIVIGLSSAEPLQSLPSRISSANGDLICPLSSVAIMDLSCYGRCLQSIVKDTW